MKFEAIPNDGLIPCEGGGEEAKLSVLRELSQDGSLTQRELAARTGMSLGRANRVVNALVRMGLLGAERFKNARGRMAHRYVLTPEGERWRASLTHHLLTARLQEYEALGREIARLEQEAGEGRSRETVPR